MTVQETDYIMSYFDNGEEFGGDSDDNMEEAIYWNPPADVDLMEADPCLCLFVWCGETKLTVPAVVTSFVSSFEYILINNLLTIS